MRIARWIVPAAAIVVLLGSVAVAQAFGWWQTSGASIAALADATPDDIKGSSALGDISEAFGIPMTDLTRVLGIPADTPPETKLKDLEGVIEVSEARGLIAAHLGVPWEDEHEDEPAPESPTPEAGPTAAPTETHAGPTPLPAGNILPASEIKGNMTLRQVSDQCGMPLEALYKALDLGDGVSPDTQLKTLTEQVSGLEVSVVRSVVEAYQSKP